MRLLFTATHTLGGKVIRYGTFSRWNHVGLLFSDGTLIDSTPQHGVAASTMEQSVSQPHVFRYKVDQFNGDEARIREFADSQLGKSYDFKGIAAFLNPSRSNFSDAKRWFCSELVAEACVFAGTPLQRMDAWWITPALLDRSPLLTAHTPETHK